MKKLLICLPLLFTSIVVSAISNSLSYSQGYSFGESDAQETYSLFFVKGTCMSLGDDVGDPGSPVNYETCWVCPNEQGFVDFWTGYIATAKENYCDNIGDNFYESYYKGIYEGYKDKMLELSIEYNGNYYGGGAGFLSCP